MFVVVNWFQHVKTEGTCGPLPIYGHVGFLVSWLTQKSDNFISPKKPSIFYSKNVASLVEAT